MQVHRDPARPIPAGGDLAHRLATPTAKLRLYAKTLANVLPTLIPARDARASAPAPALPAELLALVPDIPARLGRLADEIDRIVTDLGSPPGTGRDTPGAPAPWPSCDLPDAGCPGTAAGPDGRVPRVLLVEDDTDSRDLMCLRLQQAGWRVDQVGDGRPALELLARERFDLILMDCRLPELDGWDATARLRAAGPNRRTPVIGLTASPDAADRARGLAVGMNDWLIKPLTTAHLAGMHRLCLTTLPDER